jgi:transcription termination factor NusA
VSRTDETPQQLFVRALKVEPRWAAVLVAEGFTTLEEVAYVPIDEFRAIEGLEEQQVPAWRAQARNLLLIKAVDGGDEEDPLTVATEKPPKPLSGGSGATIDDDEDQ